MAAHCLFIDCAASLFAEPGRKRRGRNAFNPRLFEHGRKCLQYLYTAFARLGALAYGNRNIANRVGGA